MNVEKREVKKFHSEIKELLQLMVHSLYSNKEIFLRELISNSSDAIDKMRFQLVSNSKIIDKDDNFSIEIFVDKKNRILSIRDNGIGMSKSDVINNIGTIAKSGTKKFLNLLKNNKNIQLIGKYGVGFYSAFIVSERVLIRSRFLDFPLNEGVLWESDGKGEYFISNVEKKQRGTEVLLFIKEDQLDFLDEYNLERIILKYSNYISVPIKLRFSEKNKEDSFFWKTVNQVQALWVRDKKEISEEDYKNFYKYLTNDYEDPLLWTHNKVEGKIEYVSLIYIPRRSSIDLWNRSNLGNLKLYSNRIFITDKVEGILPNYLRFVKGLVDSDEFSLNISRETIQNKSIIRSLSYSLTKNILQMLLKLLKNNFQEYQNFWKEYRLIFKEGVSEDLKNKKIISNLLLFSSTYNDSDAQNVSLKEYVKRMKSYQDKIYYLTSDNYFSAKTSPYLEIFKKEGLEVLLLFDKIDEWMMNYLSEFSSKKFHSIIKDDEIIKRLANENKLRITSLDEKEDFREFLVRVKKSLGDKIKEVKITYRLLDSPALVTTSHNEMTTQMAKLFSSIGQSVPKIEYNFEINLDHPLVKKIYSLKDEKLFSDWINILLDEALLIEKGFLENPNSFISRINELFLNFLD